MKELSEFAEQQQAKIAEIVRNDPYAPLFHFISPSRKCECFDPNGAIFWKGRYHLFYIFQDEAYRTGPEFWQRGHCWGHASSTDLVHWTHHPTALAPRPGDPDAATYSGCALINREGIPTIVYHGYGAGTCIATATDDDLINWQKSPHNPVIAEPKQEGDPGWGVYNVFDPHVWLEGETYYAILGGKVKPDDNYDTAYLFQSMDMVHWEYLHPLYTPNPQWTDDRDDCACPKFFRLGDRQVLLCISHATGTRTYLGRYDGQTFLPEEHHLMNWPGGCCFAPETLLDDRNRRIMWAWAVDQRLDWWKTGELGVMTMPRVLSLDSDGTMQIEPPVELESLRGNHKSWGNIVLADGEERLLEGVSGDCLEIILETQVPESGRFGLKVRVSPGGEEQTAIIYDAAASELLIDTSWTTLARDGWRPYPMDFWRGIEVENLEIQRTPFRLRPDEPLALRIFLDRSILEVFVNNRQFLTQRIYPTRPDSRGVTLFAEDVSATLQKLDVWEMQAVNAGDGKG